MATSCQIDPGAVQDEQPSLTGTFVEYRLAYYYPSRNTSHPDSSEYHVVSERIRLIRHIHVDPTVCTLTCQL